MRIEDVEIHGGPPLRARSGALAGAAGVMWGLHMGIIYHFVGFIPGLKAFTAAVLGGIGKTPPSDKPTVAGVGIGVATSAAGIIVGTITLTGIGQVMIEFVEFISGGNLMLILLFTAVISLILGMGLPTTANYIVVSTLMAPVIVDLD